MVTIERGMDDHTIYLTVQVLMASDNDCIPSHVRRLRLYKLGIPCLISVCLESLSVSYSTYAAIHVHLEGYQLLGSAIQA